MEPHTDLTARVAIDGMGGDHAPGEVVAGTVESARRLPKVHHILVGPEPVMRDELAKHGKLLPNLHVEPASQTIGMGEHPVEALRGKPDSSIAKIIKLVKGGRADAAFSAGNTGAMVAAATLMLGMLPTVKRPAIAVPLPTKTGFAALLDAGANPNCKPVHLVQYAVMGAMYIKCLDPSRPHPAVGLMNIGEESGKGTPLIQDTYETLRNTSLNFRGNVEGHQIFNGEWDVLVCDGFVGNTILKVAEGLGAFVMNHMMNGLAEIPGVREKFGALQQRMDYSEYGGAPLLGVNGIALIGHGRSDARAITNAIHAGAEFVRRRLNELIVDELKKLSWWGRLLDSWRSSKPGEGGEAS